MHITRILHIYVEQGCEDPWLCVEAKRGPREKKRLGNTVIGY
jgi:hypothetical protein